MKPQTSEAECAESVFLMQSPICTVNFANISRPGCAWQPLKPFNYLIQV